MDLKDETSECRVNSIVAPLPATIPSPETMSPLPPPPLSMVPTAAPGSEPPRTTMIVDMSSYCSPPVSTVGSTLPGSTSLSLWPWLRYADEEADGSSTNGDQVESLVNFLDSNGDESFPNQLNNNYDNESNHQSNQQLHPKLSVRRKSSSSERQSRRQSTTSSTENNTRKQQLPSSSLKRAVTRVRSGSSGAGGPTATIGGVSIQRFSRSTERGIIDRRASVAARVVDFPSHPSSFRRSQASHRSSSRRRFSDRDGSSSSVNGTTPVNLDLPYPDYTELSFRCLTQTSPVRRICLTMISNPYPFHRHKINQLIINF